MYNINVDAKAIAKGLYDLIFKMPDRDNYLAAIKLGMTPAPLMQSLEKMLGEKFDEIALERLKMTAEELTNFNKELGEDVLQIDKDKRRKFINSVTLDVHLELLKIGNCIC